MLIEVDEESFGVERVSRDRNGVIEAGRRLDEALQAARPTIRAVVQTVREMVPDEFEIEFGLKLNAEAGVVVAKTAAEGHFTVRLGWQRSSEGRAGA
ncbi:CU044_2847 family protein [Streptomyces sp. NPDC048479]|uniref:CU044_2847 family protein n=1 Tax=unclassified Streptomyces TaxID=2593676 RepID=UPI003428F409